MRPPVALMLSLLVVSFLHGQTFPAAITPELPVSVAMPGTAAGSQGTPQLAPSVECRCAAWLDGREGGTAVYGARIDAAGNVLDPMGVRLAYGYSLQSVAWNGEAFVIIAGTTFTLVSPDLKTITTKE